MSWADLAEWDLSTRRRAGPRQVETVTRFWQHMAEYFEDVDPRRLTYAHVEGYCTHRLQTIRGQSLRRELQALKRGRLQAKARGVRLDPIDMWPDIPTDSPKAAQAGQLHDPDILMRWLDAIRARVAKDPRGWPAAEQAELVLRTGLRVEEARKLRFWWLEPVPEDIPGVVAYLRVPADCAKWGIERIIGVTPEALRIIAELRQAMPEGEPLCPRNHRRVWAGAERDIGYDQHITARDLRHCWATYGSEGGDLLALSKALGHKHLSTTQRYLHPSHERSAAVSAGVGQILGSRDTPGRDTRPQGVRRCAGKSPAHL